MQKINFISPIAFEMLKLKNPAIWLAESIFALNSRTRFFTDRQFQQNHKGSYDAWFEPKKSTHQWTIFLLNKKKPILVVFLDIIPKMRFFYQKSSSVSFLPLRHPNFMRSFRKILWAILEKTHLPTDILIQLHLTVVKS